MSDNNSTPHSYTNGSSSAPQIARGAFFVPSTQAGEQATEAKAEDALVETVAPIGASARASVRAPATAPGLPPTIFPQEFVASGLAGLTYTLGRAQLAAFPLANWVVGAAIMASLLLALRGGPWPWLGLTLVIASVWLRLRVWQAGRNDWVRFAAHQQRAPIAGARLDIGTKFPVYVTGCLEVGERVRRFAMLPGYYRTFATREHALLCLCRGGRRLWVGAWPEVEVGLWYGFFRPESIRDIERGALYFGATEQPALAIDIKATPTRGRFRRRAIERIFIAADASVLDHIEADLRADLPPAAQPAP